MSRPTLLCLHGWGGTAQSFDLLREHLAGADLRILTPDLPGFGVTPEPPSAWCTDDYADWVETWIAERIPPSTPFLLLGHSHGGRIALTLSARHPKRILHLYLCAAAGIYHPRHLKRTIGLTLAKSGKLLLALPGIRALEPLGKKLLYKLIRVHDYEKASPVMRETLIRVTRQDFRSLLAHIHVPTDLFWGEDDRMTPIADGVLMHRGIAGSVLHRYPGVRHGVHRDRAEQIAGVIRSPFLSSSPQASAPEEVRLSPR